MNAASSDHQRRPLITGQLLILCGGFFFAFLGPGALQQFLIPTLQDNTGRSAPECSLVLALVYLAGAASLTIYAHCLRFLREKPSLVLGLLTYTLFALAVALKLPYWAMLLAAALWGWGAEVIWATGPTRVLDDSDRAQYGSVSGFFSSATYSGQMIGVLILGSVLARPGWGAPAMLGLAVAFGLTSNLLSLALSTKSVDRKPPQFSDALAALRNVQGRYIIALVVANCLGWGLLLSGFGTLMADLGALSKLHWVTLPYYAGRLLIAWLAGRLSDACGRERVLIVGFLLSAAVLGLASQTVSALIVAILAAVLGAQAANITVNTTAMVGDVIEPKERPAIFAGINAWGYVATGVTVLLSQYLRWQFGNFALCFGLFGATYLGCALLTWNLARTRRRSSETDERDKEAQP